MGDVLQRLIQQSKSTDAPVGDPYGLRSGDEANIFIYKICVILKEMGNLFSTLHSVGRKSLTYTDTAAFSGLMFSLLS